MLRSIYPFLFLAAVVCGCGPSANELRERTLSALNTEADRWDGDQKFTTTASDAYGRALTCTVQKTTLDYVLEIRSNGPDGLPKNSDDIVVIRSKRHNMTSITKETAKAVEEVSSGASSGVIKGIKRELGFGDRNEKKK